MKTMYMMRTILPNADKPYDSAILYGSLKDAINAKDGVRARDPRLFERSWVVSARLDGPGL